MQDVIRLDWSHGLIHLITNRTKTDRSPSIESQTRDFIEEKKGIYRLKKKKKEKNNLSSRRGVYYTIWYKQPFGNPSKGFLSSKICPP